ncbi:hypothetical protein QFZ66_001077 [Streptomyces sp. B4I13]|nr:hypothetical protein [Streptomyces sp. B4I13]
MTAEWCATDPEAAVRGGSSATTAYCGLVVTASSSTMGSPLFRCRSSSRTTSMNGSTGRLDDVTGHHFTDDAGHADHLLACHLLSLVPVSGSAARPASSRATGTRNGEQET